MRVFVVAAAVLVGLANAALYSAVPFESNIDDALEGWGPERWSLSGLYALTAVFAGLVISAGVLRFAASGLRGGFFARYGVMVLAIWLGGVLLSALLTAAAAFFDERMVVRSSDIAGTVAFALIPGGVLGAVEGVLLAFPLARLLGLLKDRTNPRAEPSA